MMSSTPPLCPSAAIQLPHSSLPARFGTLLRRHQDLISILQWVMVGLYLVLLLAPAAMPAPAADARFYNNFRLFAQFLLWGIWWPGVLLSTMLFGRVWCGIFCPEGALTEWASQHGRNRSIPRWMRWRGWPFATFAFVTLYGQLTGMFQRPQAALLLLGSSTALALVVGYTYGKKKRIWCRYLCPANAVFAPLAKTALLHFKVDPEPWKRHRGRLPTLNCAPLIDIRHMKSTSACHACGRCSDYLGAVALAVRRTDTEILNSQNKDTSSTEALTLIFGLIGIATAACHWSGSRWLAMLKSAASAWLADHPALRLLQLPASSWLRPDLSSDTASTWLDGACLLAFIAGGATLLGLAVLGMICISNFLTRLPQLSWQRLTLALVPLAGVSLLLGLSLPTLALFKNTGTTGWMEVLVIVPLAGGTIFSGWLGWKMICPAGLIRRNAAFLVFALTLLLINFIWAAELFHLRT
jgi:polyferredoxin